MTRNDAYEITKTHLNKKNPTNWDGNGESPPTFDPSAKTYVMSANQKLIIRFEYNVEDQAWEHVCELRNDRTHAVTLLHGYGINSPENLTDTIEYICLYD